MASLPKNFYDRLHYYRDMRRIFLDNPHNAGRLFPVIATRDYLYTIKYGWRVMALKRYTYYLLFFAAYIGALVIEKPVYSVNTVQACFSYMFTVIVHFCIFALMLVASNSFLIPYLLAKNRFGLYFAGLVAVVLSYTILVGHYNRFIHGTLFHDDPIDTSSTFWENFVYGTCCSVITAMLYIIQKWAEQQEQVKNSQINQLQTELKYLRSQINPHFLFNGLNTVYGYIDMGNRQARDMMVQFSDLLRYNLYEADVDMIELEKEVKYLKNYVALQKARSNDNVEVNLKINYQDGAVKVAPLIFMAFVENAFKYVSRGDAGLNEVSITLSEEEGKIGFTCENSCDEEAEAAAGGIGLNNAVRRLELLYRDRYKLNITKQDNRYKVDLTLMP